MSTPLPPCDHDECGKMKCSLVTYRDPQGVTHSIRIERAADTPGFFVCWTATGRRLVLHMTDIRRNGEPMLRPAEVEALKPKPVEPLNPS